MAIGWVADRPPESVAVTVASCDPGARQGSSATILPETLALYDPDIARNDCVRKRVAIRVGKVRHHVHSRHISSYGQYLLGNRSGG